MQFFIYSVNMAFNKQQKQFAIEYIKDWNATQAAKRAGYSETAAYSQGHRLLKNADVQRYISEYINEHVKNTNRIIKENIDLWRNLINNSEDENVILKSSELLGKTVGQFSDKMILQGDKEAPLTITIEEV